MPTCEPDDNNNKKKQVLPFSLENFGKSIELSTEQNFSVASLAYNLESATKEQIIEMFVALLRNKYQIDNINKHLLKENMELHIQLDNILLH